MTEAVGLFSLLGTFRSVGSRYCLSRLVQKWLQCQLDANCTFDRPIAPRVAAVE